jgi:mono/diheme cytochrome c family protein
MKFYLVLISLVFVAACKKDQPNVELVQNMMESPAYKAQDHNPEAVDGRSMLLPPENTVAKNHLPYRYKGKPADAAKYLSNPFANEDTMARGKEMYETYCLVCHGKTGAGEGTVAEYMALKPPSLVTDKVKKMSDAEIYHIIADGRGLMGSYATQVVSDDRWKIVNYVRELQKNAK